MIFRSTVHHRNRWSVVRHLEASYDGGVVQRPRGVVRRRCRTTPGGVVTAVVSYDTSRRRTTPPSSSHPTLGNQRPMNVDYLFGTCLWQLLLLQDPQYFHLPCGHEFFSFKFRPSCTLACCVVYPGEETDSDWDSQATVLDEEPEEGDTDDK